MQGGFRDFFLPAHLGGPLRHTPTQEHGPRGEISRSTRLCHRFWCVSTKNTSFCMSKWCTCRRTTNHLLAPVPARYRACCVHTDIAPVPSKGSIGQLDPGLVLACTELGAFDLSRMVPVLWRVLAPVVCGSALGGSESGSKLLGSGGLSPPCHSPLPP